MHEFVDGVPLDQRSRSLLGSDEVEGHENEQTYKGNPWKKFFRGQGRSGCRIFRDVGHDGLLFGMAKLHHGVFTKSCFSKGSDPTSFSENIVGRYRTFPKDQRFPFLVACLSISGGSDGTRT
jgi:hypothetical protein